MTTTSAIYEKNFEEESFSIFCSEATVMGCSIHFSIDFSKTVISRCRKTVISLVSLLPATNYRRFLLPAIKLSPASWNRWKSVDKSNQRCHWHRKKFIAGNNDTGNKHKVANISANLSKISKWSHCHWDTCVRIPHWLQTSYSLKEIAEEKKYTLRRL